jgi:5-methyltetrahydropteroyltriglutamate--homocysteine methyltransferase
MSLCRRPPFRADHVGSFLRPRSLLDMRDRHQNGALASDALRAHENACIADLVEFEKSLDLQSPMVSSAAAGSTRIS